MGKSFKKNPYSGMTTCSSEKSDKRIANRKTRRKLRELISEFDEDMVNFDKRDFSDVWSFGKDGKNRIDSDSEYYMKAMRK